MCEFTWDKTDVITEEVTSELGKLGMANIFDFPKPTYLVKKSCQLDLIVTLYVLISSGSGILADAVMPLNAERKSKYIAFQLPSNLYLRI